MSPDEQRIDSSSKADFGKQRHLRLAGSLLVLGTLWTVVAIHIAEALTPGYTIWGQAVSGLGATYFGTYACFIARCNSIYQPASIILVSSFMLDGALLLLAVHSISRAPGLRSVSRMTAVFGVGMLVLGCSYLPLYIGGAAANFNLALVLHLASAVFLVSVVAILAIRADAFMRPWLKYISRVIGAVVLVAALLYTSMFMTDSLWGPGFGGVERIGFYAILLWFLGYGIYLITAADNN